MFGYPSDMLTNKSQKDEWMGAILVFLFSWLYLVALDSDMADLTLVLVGLFVAWVPPSVFTFLEKRVACHLFR